MSSVHLCAVNQKGTNSVLTVTGWSEKLVQLSNNKWHTFRELLENFTFLDGSVCGIEEDEI